MKNSGVKIFTLILITTYFLAPKVMSQAAPSRTPIDYFTNFNKFTQIDLNEDSALFCIQKLASNKKAIQSMQSLMHNFYAQIVVDRSFLPETDSAVVKEHQRKHDFNKNLLIKIMEDSSKVLTQTFNTLYLYSKIEDAAGNNAQLARLTNQFIQEELSDSDIYSNRAGRYGLMIYGKINSIPELKPLSEKLFRVLYNYLEKGQIPALENPDRFKSEERAWYRYLYAYSNYIQSEKETDFNSKKEYLKKAFDYSPDLADVNHMSAYFYDMHFILEKEKGSFREEYLTFLTDQATNQNDVLSILLQITLQQPEYKERLKTAYVKVKGSEANFGKYWMQNVNQHAKAAPPISLSMLDKSKFSSKAGAGKWLLVDFWGTWCGPCRAEHPDMQKFFDSTVKTNADKITFLTIACRDTEEKVTDYMAEKKFSFPVAMSDNQIEKTYKVAGYPTKLLVTPEGNYLIVPFGADWISFVKHYTDL
ncbi:MAG: TlpA family protein disulfide reductase [Dyadobacter sp.]|uniref:TlpA family protein disulfide reductase n=1 Tax=Dyadobacter sp. TaxID=1914288 RepID=UPI001B0B6B85|nr:TlpA disulfide reductase family protein [Dyadobacter sp.]MBO9613429.1 TlpA family protein disulfide reductase [Dyadobacter sp.]